ncbi:MAG: PAS domain S-box protein [Gemmatimonadota bacterium]|nr:PAS domain S-box protein [Gemmatimonadota bacterium]
MSTIDYQALFSLAADGIVVTDAAHRIVDANDAFVRMVGLERDKLIGRDPSSLIARSEVQFRPTMLEDLARDGILLSVRRLMHADGSSVPVEIHATAMPDGTTIGIVRIVRHRPLADALRSAEERLRVVGESLNVALVVTDAENKAVYANEQMAVLTGYSAEELVGRVMDDLLVANDAELDSHMIARRNGIGEKYVREHYRKDGSTFIASISGSPLNDDRGVFTGTVAVVEDITERQRMAHELAERELRYRSLFEVTPLPTWVFDLETLRFRAVNPAASEQYGYTEEEFLVMTLLDIRTPKDAIEFAEYMKVSYPAPLMPRAQHRKKDGSIITVALVGEDFMLEGRPSRLIIARDITDEVRMSERQRNVEQQLRLAQKMEAVGSLAGGVAHDFNNLLSVMLGASESLGHALPRESVLQEDVKDIRESAERGAALTRQLLSLGRRDVHAPTLIDLNEVVHSVTRLLQRAIGPQVRTEISCASHALVVLADAGQLEQVLMNLAINARDAMPTGGTLHMETRVCTLDAEAAAFIGIDAGTYACAIVCDDGTGMDEATRARAFEPFFTTKGPTLGTGLGLSTAYGILRQAGGGISLESLMGTGTCVTIYLPRSRGHAATGESRRSAEHRAIGARGRVLLVEDDPRVRAQARRLLERSGFTLTEAEDGAAGLERFLVAGGAFDVVVTDVMMPRIGGVDMVSELRQTSPSIPVVFVSGYTASDRELPLDDRTLFVAKPYSIHALCTAIDSLIAD